MKRLSSALLVLTSLLALHGIGCFGGESDGTGDSAGTEDGLPQDSGTLALSHAGDAIVGGATYNIPDNNDPASSNVALFSEQKDLMTLTNTTAANITIHSISVTAEEGFEAEEFSIRDAESLKNELLEVSDVVVAGGATFDFYIRFYPVYSGERRATLSVKYLDSEGEQELAVHITASGRPSDNAVKFSGGTEALHKVLGSTGTDEQVTGMVGDADGNTYFLAQTKVVPGYDGFYYDLVFGQVKADGTIGWAKIYSRSNAWEWSPDPGQNDETGGSPNAITIDSEGYLYIAGSMSSGNTNNDTAAHVMKVKAADGSIVWDKLWRPEWTTGSFLDRMGAVGYAVAVGGNRVFVTGSTGDGNVHGVLGSGSSVLLLALDKADGTLAFHHALDVAKGYNDRGYAVVADATGANVFVGGLTNGRGLLVKYGKTDGAAPEVAWVKQLDMGTGSNVYGLDSDGTDAYLALDRRGAATFFSVAKVNGADGSIAWSKTFESNAGDSNNCNVVKVFGDFVYAGGRIGVSVMDAQMGDGFMLRLGKADGALSWSGIYYTGKGPNEIEEHRIKGFAVAGNTLYVAGQVYTGSTGDETYRYDGYWYDGIGNLVDFKELVAASVAELDPFEPTNGEVRDTSASATVVYDPLPAVLEFVDAVSKKLGTGGTVDEDLFWMKFDLK